jgi:hypothetical protein
MYEQLDHSSFYEIKTPHASKLKRTGREDHLQMGSVSIPHTPNYAAIIQSPGNAMAPSPLPPGYEMNSECIFRLGEKVVVDGGKHEGILKFYGPVKFQSGLWAGIELDEATGKNDGSVDG